MLHWLYEEIGMEVKPQNDEKLVVKYGGIPGSEFEDLNMSGSSFKQVALAEAKLDRVNMVHASFQDVNLSNMTVHSVTMGGAKFKHVSLHPDENGNVPKQDVGAQSALAHRNVKAGLARE